MQDIVASGEENSSNALMVVFSFFFSAVIADL